MRFPGQYYDEETGLHYNWHRYYDPDTGRYLTPDPIGLAGGINPFVYVENDPVNWVDLLGLDMMDSYWNFNGKPNIPHSSNINLTPPSQQTLKSFSHYSAPFVAGSFITGNIPAIFVFTGIGVGAEVLDTALYSDFKTIDYTKTGVKLLDPIPPPFDFFSKELIDQGFNNYEQMDQSSCQ